MNANNAKLTSISAVETGANSNATNVTPNLIAGVPSRTFDVVVEGVAGSYLGLSGAPYTLVIIAYSITNGANVDDLNPVIPPQTFTPPHLDRNWW